MSILVDLLSLKWVAVALGLLVILGFTWCLLAVSSRCSRDEDR